MMRQMNVIAVACLGGIALALCYATDFFPLIATVVYLGALAYVALAPESKKKQAPAEPWYMK
jgi:hypothetical protein